MRGSRQRSLYLAARILGSKTQDRWEGRTFIRGGVKRAYRDLKKMWKRKGVLEPAWELPA